MSPLVGRHWVKDVENSLVGQKEGRKENRKRNNVTNNNKSREKQFNHREKRKH
jgi:hypothetical protein